MYEIETLGVRTLYGKSLNISVRKNTNDSMIITSIILYDEYKSGKISYQNGDTFIDLGSHIGVWALMMAALNPTLKVYAYEPIPENFKLLQKNREQNGLNNLYPFQLAISMDSVGKEKIYYNSNDSDFTKFHRFIGHPGPQGDKVDVQKISIDDIFKNNNIQRCRVLKSDCEGCEIKGFATASSETLQKIDYIVGEFHPPTPRTAFWKFFEPYFVDITNPPFRPEADHSLQQFMFKNKRLV